MHKFESDDDESDMEYDLAELVQLFPAISLCTCHSHGNRPGVVCGDMTTNADIGGSPELLVSEQRVRRTLSRKSSRSGFEPGTPDTPTSRPSRISMPTSSPSPDGRCSSESDRDIPSSLSSHSTSDSRSRKASSGDLSNLANMERELLCPACSELFTQPLVLPCQHSICHRCAKAILYRDSPDTPAGSVFNFPTHSPMSQPATPRPTRQRTASGPGLLKRAPSFRRKSGVPKVSTPTTPKSPPLKEFPCPKCQQGVELGPKGINGLYRNFILETIVERYKFAARKAGAIPCQSCKPRPPADATKTCLDCHASFCNECFKTVHIWGTPKAQHEYVGPTSSFRPRALLCVEHETEKVTMYCQACKRPVCHLCKLGGAHTNHKFHHMNTAYKSIEEKLRSSLKILKDKQEKVEEQKRVVMEKRENFKKTALLVKDDIVHAFDSLYAVLDDRKSALLQKAEKVMSARESDLDAALAQSREMMGISGLIEYVEQVLKENNHACFLQTATGLCKRVKEATEMPLPLDLDVTGEPLTLDVTREQKMLSQLDFLQAPNKVVLCTDAVVAQEGRAEIVWTPPEPPSPPADSHLLHYWKMAAVGDAEMHDGIAEAPPHAQTVRCNDVISCQLTELEPGAWYGFRVRACNAAGSGPWSDVGTIRTLADLSFDIEGNYDREALRADNKERTITSVMTSTLRPDDSAHHAVTMDTHYVTGDVKLTSGRHYWEVEVERHSFLAFVGVADERAIPPEHCRQSDEHCRHNDEHCRQSDADSGHDSCDENETVGVTNAMATVTVTMGILENVDKNATACCHGDRGSRVGIFVDADEGTVRFYDVISRKMVKECSVDAGKVLVPLIGLCGPGIVHY